MKKSLFIRTALLGSASALAVTALALPTTSFASNGQGNSDQSALHARGFESPRPARGPRGVIGSVSGISVDSSGNGTLKLTITKAPEFKVSEHSKHRPRHFEPLNVGDTVTININSETKFMINGVESTANNLENGSVVRVLGGGKNTDSKTARLITTNLQVPTPGQAGTVTNIDTNENVMTISFPATKELSAGTAIVEYSDNTLFLHKGTRVTESSVAVGSLVHFNGQISDDDDSKTFINVEVIGIR